MTMMDANALVKNANSPHPTRPNRAYTAIKITLPGLLHNGIK